MNDIEILEKLIDKCKCCKFATCEQCEISWTEVKVIKKLINRVKELEEKLVDKICRGVEEEVLEEYRQKIKNLEEIEKEHKEENGKLREQIKELESMLSHRIKYTSELEADLFENSTNWVVPKDKIREKIEELKSNKDFDMDVYVEEYAVDILQELLEE